MEYLLGWLFLYFCLIVFCFAGYRGRLPFLFFLIFFAALAFLRGDVGPDTLAYAGMLERVFLYSDWSGGEPGFLILGWGLTWLFGETIAVRIFSFIYFFLIAFFVIRSNRNERFLLMSYMAPAFFYVYSMNTIRLGLATALLMLATQSWGRLSGWCGGMISVAFHYSSMLAIFYIWAVRARILVKRNLLIALFFVVVILLVFLINYNYFLSKLYLYKDISSPSLYSGLSKVLVLLVLSVSLVFSRLDLRLKIKVIIFTVGATALSFWIGRYSYAGLRILDILAFAQPLAVTVLYNGLSREFDFPVKIGLLLAGMLSVAGVFRNFISEAATKGSPFMPYQIHTLFNDVF